MSIHYTDDPPEESGMGFLRRKTLAAVSGLLAVASLLGCIPQLGCASVSNVQKPVQACEWDRTWRTPNAQELRMMVYTSLAYGARGIAYFHYWGSGYFGALYRDRKRMPVMDAIVRLNAEIATLSPILMSLDSVGVYHAGLLPVGTKRVPLNSQVKVISETPLVVGLFTDKARKRYFMLSSRDYKLETVSNVLVRDAQSVSEFDRVKKSWKRLDGTNLHLRIAAGDGRLFRID